MDKLPTDLNFSDSSDIKIKYAWSIKKISKFIRLYVNINLILFFKIRNLFEQNL